MGRIGDYTVERELKSGGMGRTLLARAPDGRTVVLKLPLVDDPAAFARMRNEARLGRAVAHRHLVETLDAFEHEGRPVIAVAWVEGASVLELVRGGPLDAAIAAHIGMQVASALGAMHSARNADGRTVPIVHRDISPGNIVVDLHGDAFVIDLGVARLAEARSAPPHRGALLGTARFVAPELVQGGDHSPHSDVWSLCCVVAELVRGQPLFAGGSHQVLQQLKRYSGPGTLPLDAIPPPLGDVLRAGLATEPHARPDATALARELAGVAVGADLRQRLGRRVDDARRGIFQGYDTAEFAAVTDPLARSEPGKGAGVRPHTDPGPDTPGADQTDPR